MTANQAAGSKALLPAIAEPPSNKQRLFVRYFTAILIDLVVLNLFVEFWSSVSIDSFSTSLLTAIVLQILVKLTMAIERSVGTYFSSKPGRLMTFLRFFLAWVVLFGSKLIILEAIAALFGDHVRFDGRLHGLVALVTVIFAMLIAEEAMVRLYRRLGDTAS
jgi:hypothetical protein